MDDLVRPSNAGPNVRDTTTAYTQKSHIFAITSLPYKMHFSLFALHAEQAKPTY